MYGSLDLPTARSVYNTQIEHLILCFISLLIESFCFIPITSSNNPGVQLDMQFIPSHLDCKETYCSGSGQITSFGLISLLNSLHWILYFLSTGVLTSI